MYDAADLAPGQEIEYTIQRARNKVKTRVGIVVQITNRHVTVNLGSYKDSFHLCDITPALPGREE